LIGTKICDLEWSLLCVISPNMDGFGGKLITSQWLQLDYTVSLKM